MEERKDGDDKTAGAPGGGGGRLGDLRLDTLEARTGVSMKDLKKHLRSHGGAIGPALAAAGITSAAAAAAAASSASSSTASSSDSDDAAARVRLSLACLNTLIADALVLMPRCVAYLAQLHDPGVFRFCAIPQLMALGTLAELYDNPMVFTGVVKVRKGLACRMLLGSGTMPDVLAWFLDLSGGLRAKAAKARAAAARDVNALESAGPAAAAAGKASKKAAKAIRATLAAHEATLAALDQAQAAMRAAQ